MEKGGKERERERKRKQMTWSRDNKVSSLFNSDERTNKWTKTS